MAVKYREPSQFVRESELLRCLFDQQEAGWTSQDDRMLVFFETLADAQRKMGIGCVYIAGSRIDNKYCVGSNCVGILHSALPTDYDKAAIPSFHESHDELIVCTSGDLIVEWSEARSVESLLECARREDALAEKEKETSVVRAHFGPGDHQLIRRGWPHRIVVDTAALSLDGDAPDAKDNKRPWASFLAVKMGQLGAKGQHEDMAKWSEMGLQHPLIEQWKQDKAFLKHLRVHDDVRARFCLPRNV